MTPERARFLKRLVPASVFVGGLCCFTPIVLLLLGVSSVTYAASLADVLYGQYKWVFRSVSLLMLLGAIAWYFYTKENVCTFDAFKRKRNEILNVVLIAVIIATIGYIVWLYGVVHVIGVWLGLW